MYDVLALLSVFTTAYAFIPYGWILRERTDVWLGLTLAFIGGAVFLQRSNTTLIPSTLRFHPSLRLQRLCQVTLALLMGFAMASTYSSHQHQAAPVPFNGEERVATAAIWTLHFGLDNRMHDSQRRVSELLEDAQIDILGILESDLNHIVTGNRDMVQRIAQEKGYFVDLGPGPHKRTWSRPIFWLRLSHV